MFEVSWRQNINESDIANKNHGASQIQYIQLELRLLGVMNALAVQADGIPLC